MSSQLKFEQQTVVSEQTYLSIYSDGLKPTRLAFVLGIGVLGVLSLLWVYTVALGILFLIAAVSAALFHRLLPIGIRSIYRRSAHLHQPLTCGVSDTEMWVHGRGFRCSTSWDNLNVWRQSGDWLVLTPHGTVSVFLRIDELRRAQVYEQVVTLARSHAAEFGSPARQAVDS
jgi:hypothetical protein